LLEQTTDGRPRTRAIAYLGADSRARTEVLRGAGFDTVLVVPESSERLVHIALDAAAAARRADTVVIASEDGSLAPIAVHLRALGVRCEFASFDSRRFAETERWGATVLELSDDSRIVP
ncbi:MAG: NYN domain-containing protein, partial [Planctomycetes bacterium]|nr:NYN domain-containing protein [Planctomycetota bacterium]